MAARGHHGDSLEDQLVKEILQENHNDVNDQTSNGTSLDFGRMAGEPWFGFKALPASIASRKPTDDQMRNSRPQRVQNEATVDNNTSFALLANSQLESPGGLHVSKETFGNPASAQPCDYRWVAQMNEMMRHEQGMPRLQDNSVTEEAGEELDTSGSEAVQKVPQEDLDEPNLNLKQMLRRESNRAAARRSNIKKKLEKEAQKRELAILRKMELELRAKDVQLRQENLWLRSLVFPNGYNR